MTLLSLFYYIYIFFHEDYCYFFMFRDVPGCSGIFRHVPECSVFLVLSTPFSTLHVSIRKSLGTRMDVYKTWTTSVDLVHGPLLGPGPWTTPVDRP